MKFLTKEQVAELTGYKKHVCQKRALRQMGIDFWPRPDGRPIVIESDVMINQPIKTQEQKVELNLSVI